MTALSTDNIVSTLGFPDAVATEDQALDRLDRVLLYGNSEVGPDDSRIKAGMLRFYNACPEVKMTRLYRLYQDRGLPGQTFETFLETPLSFWWDGLKSKTFYDFHSVKGKSDFQSINLIPADLIGYTSLQGGIAFGDQPDAEFRVQDRIELKASVKGWFLNRLKDKQIHDGVMVALAMPEPVAKRLARMRVKWPEGSEIQPISEMHVTLAYIGDISQVTISRSRLIDIVTDIAETFPKPVDGKVNGIGRFFECHKPGMDVIYASFDSPDIPELRQRILDALEANGVKIEQKHGFTPHITLAYIPAGTEAPVSGFEVLDTIIPGVIVAWGGKFYKIPFGDLTYKGGPGSGDYGHAGRPGKRGGSVTDNRFVTVFHGTKDEFEKNIRKYGVIVNSNRWFHNKPAIYVCKNEEDVKKIAVQWSNMTDTDVDEEGNSVVHFAVVKARVPIEYIEKSFVDEKANRDFGTSTSTGLVEKKIKPEWIESITHYTYPFNTNSWDGTYNPKDVDKALATVNVEKEAGWQVVYVLYIVRKPEVTEKGGPGSGDYGHAGRPGELGGSSKISNHTLPEMIAKDSEDVGYADIKAVARAIEKHHINLEGIRKIIVSEVSKWPKPGTDVMEKNAWVKLYHDGAVRVIDKLVFHDIDGAAEEVTRWDRVDSPVTVLKGGAGSGDFGHAGRPGKVGGSAGGGIHAGEEKEPWQMTLHEWMTRRPLPPQTEIPEKGDFWWLGTDDGGLYVGNENDKSHVMLAERLGIPPERIRAGGYIDDGDISYSYATTANVRAYMEQNQAMQKVLHRNAVWKAIKEGKPVPPEVLKDYPAYEKLLSKTKGGAGSGDFGHAGRPGRVGGSAADGGAQAGMVGKAEHVEAANPDIFEADNFDQLKATLDKPLGPENPYISAFLMPSGKLLFSNKIQDHNYLITHTPITASELSDDDLMEVQNHVDVAQDIVPKMGLFRVNVMSFPGHNEITVLADGFNVKALRRLQKAVDQGAFPYAKEIEWSWETSRGSWQSIKVSYDELMSAKFTHTDQETGQMTLKDLSLKGGQGSGFYGHAGRPGKVGGSSATGSLAAGTAEAPYITISSRAYPPGTEAAYMGHTRQPTGAPIRGTAISPDDPRIPDTVYHMTTDMPAVKASGVLLARGVGGLGGDKYDQLVSTTISKDIADQLAKDTAFAATMSKKYLNAPYYPVWDSDTQSRHETPENDAAWNTYDRAVFDDLEKQSKTEGWDFSKHIPWYSDDPQWGSQLKYSIHDMLNQYFSSREFYSGNDKLRNPLFFSPTEDLARIDPAKIGVISIPKSNYRTGAMLTDLDLDNPYGLQEIRIYGDLPLTGATYETVKETTEKGGAGSGYFGHAGRPGRVGGSAPGKGGAAAGEVQPGVTPGIEPGIEAGVDVGLDPGYEFGNHVNTARKGGKVDRGSGSDVNTIRSWAKKLSAEELSCIDGVNVCESDEVFNQAFMDTLKKYNQSFESNVNNVYAFTDTDDQQKKSIIYLRPLNHETADNFYHEVGHAVLSKSPKKGQWYISWREPNFDRHTWYSRAGGVAESFAESFGAYINSDGKVSGAELHGTPFTGDVEKTFGVVKNVIEGLPRTKEISHVIMQSERMKGGPGSGYFGHAGRPGKVGGSAGERGATGSSFDKPSVSGINETPVKMNLATSVSDHLSKKMVGYSIYRGRWHKGKEIEEDQRLQIQSWMDVLKESTGLSDEDQVVSNIYVADKDTTFEKQLVDHMIEENPLEDKWHWEQESISVGAYTQKKEKALFLRPVGADGKVRVSDGTDYIYPNAFTIFSHEYGHLVSFLKFSDGTIVISAWKKLLKNKNFDRKTRYATYSPDESFAETFALYVNSGGRNRKMSANNPMSGDFSAIDDILNRIDLASEKGGQGSGDFGHAGRPGSVGGSAAGHGAAAGESDDPKMGAINGAIRGARSNLAKAMGEYGIVKENWDMAQKVYKESVTNAATKRWILRDAKERLKGRIRGHEIHPDDPLQSEELIQEDKATVARLEKESKEADLQYKKDDMAERDLHQKATEAGNKLKEAEKLADSQVSDDDLNSAIQSGIDTSTVLRAKLQNSEVYQNMVTAVGKANDIYAEGMKMPDSQEKHDFMHDSVLPVEVEKENAVLAFDADVRKYFGQEGVTDNIKINPEEIDEQADKCIDSGIDVFNSYAGREELLDSKGAVIESMTNGNSYGKAYDTGRSYTNDNHVELSSMSFLRTTTAHELGHALENADPFIHRACVDFLNRRTKGEAEQSLREATHNKNYDEDETTKKDKFPDAYCGKIYKDESATEILSMGFSQLATSPSRFMSDDPEYFDFVYSVLHMGK